MKVGTQWQAGAMWGSENNKDQGEWGKERNEKMMHLIRNQWIGRRWALPSDMAAP